MNYRRPLQISSKLFVYSSNMLNSLIQYLLSTVKLAILTGVLVPVTVACASKQEAHRQAADQFCELHNPEHWAIRADYTALENLNQLSQQIKEHIKDPELLAIFERLAQQGYSDFYQAIQPEISQLIGQPWHCEYAKAFYAIEWNRQGVDTSNDSAVELIFEETGRIDFNGTVYPHCRDSIFINTIKVATANKISRLILKVPTATDDKVISNCLAAFESIGIQQVSVLYY